MSDTKVTAKKKYYLLASGGYLQEPRLDVLEFSEDDEEFDPDVETFDEYVNYMVKDAQAEYEQGFSQTFVIEEKDLPKLAGMINVEVNKIG